MDGQVYTFKVPATASPFMGILTGDKTSDSFERHAANLNWFNSRLSPPNLWDRLADDEDPLTSDTITDALLWVAGESTGRYWYVAARLYGTARQHWVVLNGEYVSHGVHLLNLSPHDFADTVYWAVTRNLDEKETRSFQLKLFMPPRGHEPEDDHPFFSPEAEMMEFNNSKHRG